MKTHNEYTQQNLTPDDANNILIEGNLRFTQNLKALRDLKKQVFETSQGQFPFAAILSCIDSRVPAEMVFDQGIGDVFSVRVAGNIVNEDVLGSLEYACKIAGSKIIVVMGHSKCGAVTAACNDVKLGNITALLSKIQPSVKQYIHSASDITEGNIEKVSNINIDHSIDEIRVKSFILKEMEENGEIKIVGAMYDVSTGKVTFH